MGGTAMSRAAMALVVMIGIMVVQSQVGSAQDVGQSCSADLGSLNMCAPYVVPGAANVGPPSQECCGALQSVDHGCMCSTLRVIAQLPSLCNLPPLTCSGN